MSAEQAEMERIRALGPRRCDCACGRPIYEHSRWKEPGSGKWIYSCGKTRSGHFECVAVPGWPFGL